MVSSKKKIEIEPVLNEGLPKNNMKKIPTESKKTEKVKNRVQMSKSVVKKQDKNTSPVQTVTPQGESKVSGTPVKTNTSQTSKAKTPDMGVKNVPVRKNMNQKYNQFQQKPTEDINRVVAQPITGYLDIMPDNNGYVRPNFIPNGIDAFIPNSQIRRLNLRYGDLVSGFARPPKRDEKKWGMVRIDKVNGLGLDGLKTRLKFKDLVPIYPDELVTLETEGDILSTRIIDIFCPVGFGQRGMLVSPPKAGKTTLLKEIAAGVTVNYPEVHLMAVLVGERPEEVTDLQRFIKGEVIASSFDQKPEEQTRAAEIAIERAKRLVEMGRDVFMVFDSITRLARAYNLSIPTSGRTLSGGFDPAALYPSKRFFGAARNIEKGGSLTIIGTALVDTGSKMDDLIFEEFKGTGNMELWLTRELAERRVFPAFDLNRSGTRKEELLLEAEKLKASVQIRRMMDAMGRNNGESSVAIIEQMRKTKDNKDFMAKLNKNKTA